MWVLSKLATGGLGMFLSLLNRLVGSCHLVVVPVMIAEAPISFQRAGPAAKTMTKDGPASLERQWAAGGAYRQVTEALDHEGAVFVSLPRFTMEAEFSLKPVLCALGAELAFSDGRLRRRRGGAVEHFRGHPQGVRGGQRGGHRGSSGYRRGDGPLRRLGSQSPQPKVFKADHPFLFFIKDRDTNAVLFSGRVLDPR
jgi:serpin B